MIFESVTRMCKYIPNSSLVWTRIIVTLYVYCVHFCMPGIPFDDIAQPHVGGGSPCRAIFLTYAFRFFCYLHVYGHYVSDLVQLFFKLV
jgi:hypothetical protein